MDPARHWESHNAGVVNDDHDDRQRAEKIEAGLTFPILKARVNGKWPSFAKATAGRRVMSDKTD